MNSCLKQFKIFFSLTRLSYQAHESFRGINRSKAVNIQLIILKPGGAFDDKIKLWYNRKKAPLILAELLSYLSARMRME